MPSPRGLEAFNYGRRSAGHDFSRRDYSVLEKRALDPPVPTVDSCKGSLSVDKDKAVFYSSAVEESAKAYASSIGESCQLLIDTSSSRLCLTRREDDMGSRFD